MLDFGGNASLVCFHSENLNQSGQESVARRLPVCHQFVYILVWLWMPWLKWMTLAGNTIYICNLLYRLYTLYLTDIHHCFFLLLFRPSFVLPFWPKQTKNGHRFYDECMRSCVPMAHGVAFTAGNVTSQTSRMRRAWADGIEIYSLYVIYGPFQLSHETTMRNIV